MEEDIKVVYLCDEKACKECRSNAKCCRHTSDITHAKNFEKYDDGIYYEKRQKKIRKANDYSIILICNIITFIFLIITLILLVIW